MMKKVSKGISFDIKIAEKHFLDYMIDGSLTYFHNLKYEECFFINCPGWSKVLQIVMTKYSTKEWSDPKTNAKRKANFIVKRLMFRNSYSIIPAALASFAQMFNLSVHKEVIAYKLYTKRSIERRFVSALELQLQYYQENKDKLSLKELQNNWRHVIENAKAAGAYDIRYQHINIIKYAIFYCQKDCIVLMKGMERFGRYLAEVFNETNTKMPNVHNFISISYIGYHFAHKFGCFDFEAFYGAVGKTYSRKLISLGKKSYLDIFVDEEGHQLLRQLFR